MRRLLCRLGWHPHTYRERRLLHGVEAMHFVCEACGRATPVMARTPDEYRDAARARLRPLTAHRRGAVVLDIRTSA